jgi:23S rRNA (cytidine1920-2'-O)/16S rRNA (cytidine1409-2'-O)-methyltransferase
MRIDLYLFENGLSSSRTEAKRQIETGLVKVNGRVITKASHDVSGDEEITVEKKENDYVSRGGIKLEAALMDFGVSPLGKIAIDVGASSGGFTDCLLRRGALRVLAVDSGSGQLVKSLREDKRVAVYENFNARYMKASDFDCIPSVAVMDVSFISATYIIPAIFNLLSPGGEFICLIKPQFEVGRENVGKGGIVKSEKARSLAQDKVITFAKGIGFIYKGIITSPITGGDGNVEYLAYFVKP